MSTAAQEATVDKIEADFIRIEITDKETGLVFQRQLPVKYFENSNGVVLSGETLEGTPVQLAFYSDAALAQIVELMGKGPDAPRCSHD